MSETVQSSPAPEPEGGQGGGEGQAAPWAGEEFDPARAWSLVQNLRGEAGKAKATVADLQARVKAFEDAKLSEQDKAARALKEAQTQAAEAAREAMIIREAMAAGLGADHLPFISGQDPDEIKANIAKLQALLTQGAVPPVAVRPKEQVLQGGINPPASPVDTDPLREMISQK